PPDPKALFNDKCQKCHAEDGSGKTEMGEKLKTPDFRSAKWQRHINVDEMEKAIRDGITEEGKEKMPAFKKKLTREQIQALIDYVRAFGPKDEQRGVRLTA